MDFAYSDRCQDYLKRVSQFMDAYVYEGERIYEEQHTEFGPGEGRWKVPPIIEELKDKAKAEGLWNMFHPNPKFGPGQLWEAVAADGRHRLPWIEEPQVEGRRQPGVEELGLAAPEGVLVRDVEIEERLLAQEQSELA